MILAEPGRTDPRHALGRRGEDAAARFLERAGMTIVERRYRIRQGEIDLVALEGEVVVFVEVKTRGPGALDRPAAAVDRRKQRRLATCGLAWLSGRRWLHRAARFDVVEVFPDAAERAVIRHLRDAFRVDL